MTLSGTGQGSWEPWYDGYTLNARLTRCAPRGGDGACRSGLPAFVLDKYAPILTRGAQRWTVSAPLLAAQPYAAGSPRPVVVAPT